jgi:hypothetical protein
MDELDAMHWVCGHLHDRGAWPAGAAGDALMARAERQVAREVLELKLARYRQDPDPTPTE